MARSKKRKSFSRKTKTGFAAAPTDNFQHFNDYIRVEVDRKDIAVKIKNHVKKSLSKEDAKIALQAPDWAISQSPSLAATIAWAELQLEFPTWWDAEKVLTKQVNEILRLGKRKLLNKTDNIGVVTTPRKSPAEIIKERTSDFIGGIEVIIDNWKDEKDFSIYSEMKKHDVPYITAKATYDHYIPLRDELDELVNKKTPDLIEGYSSMKVSDQKKYLKFVDNILTDIEKYMTAKKATRKTRRPVVKSAEKQVAKVQYLKDSVEFKLASISPTSLIGAMRIYLFNAKTRALTELVCEKSCGFEVKGTTLQGVDFEASRVTKLRKPEVFIPMVLKKTSNQINKEWSSLTTKTTIANGRINKDTIILRAMNK
tara:strand:+ start:11366 stop:12472 length:1107 start_codon:yes stop_codon:yes gene_type:complete